MGARALMRSVTQDLIDRAHQPKFAHRPSPLAELKWRHAGPNNVEASVLSEHETFLSEQ
ncbi:hypothetical protein J6590_035348 [Homalodisca vitripennis]|nr:hypothetical protein J6590_035348 [Homalodisca vitripennis]